MTELKTAGECVRCLGRGHVIGGSYTGDCPDCLGTGFVGFAQPADRDRLSEQRTGERWIIDIVLLNEDEALSVRAAVEKLLYDMGQVGTLSFWSEPDE